MSLTQERVPTQGRTFQPDKKSTPSGKEGRTGLLAFRYEEVPCFRREGVSEEGNGMNPVIHGDEFHRVPG